MSNNENLFLLNNSENYLLKLDNNITEIFKLNKVI
jgi:hypothetical protein